MTEGSNRVIRVIVSQRLGTRSLSSRTITDFLLARIAEDEAGAWRWPFARPGGVRETLSARVLAECKAKREIVEECERSILNDKDSRTAEWIAAQLATVYASHPDYNPAWVPKS